MPLSFKERKKILKSVNTLDLTPIKLYSEEENTDELVTIIIPKFKNKIVVKLVSPKLKSDHFKIKLDKFGSAVWSKINGKTKVDQINKQHNRTGKNALQWGIGEYNSKGGPEVHTWGNGQMFGAVLGWCMEYGANFATSWSMFEHGGDRKGSDFSLIDGANMTPRASYRHMEFVAKYFTGSFVKGIAPDTSFMVYGAQNGDQLSVMIMNRGFGEPRVPALPTSWKGTPIGCGPSLSPPMMKRWPAGAWMGRSGCGI